MPDSVPVPTPDTAAPAWCARCNQQTAVFVDEPHADIRCLACGWTDVEPTVFADWGD